MHSGKWLCALMPMTHEKTWLVSKSAYLNVIDYHALAKSLATTPATTKSNANNGITLKPEPRLLLTPSTSTEPAIVPYFVIDRKADQSMDVVWILDRSVRLVDCIWITPGRHRISSKGWVIIWCYGLSNVAQLRYRAIKKIVYESRNARNECVV